MKLLVALVSARAAIGLAAPAYGDAPGHDDAGFLAAPRQDGITYPGPDRAVAAAQAVCTCLGNGESGAGLISAKYYCPQQLSKSGSKWRRVAVSVHG